MFSDRLFRGFAAGLAGGIAMNIFSFFSVQFRLTELPFWKWAVIMVLGRQPIIGPSEFMLGLITHLIFTAILGVIFAYLVPHLTSRILLFKGWLFSVTTWFVIYGLSLLFKVQGTFPIQAKTALSNFFGANIYGLVLAYAFYWLDSREKAKGQYR